MRVLIVEDSKYMSNLIKRKLEKFTDIEICGAAYNGKEAIEQNKILKPDCITMDINMPVMNGIDAVAEIMSNNPAPIIMLSAYSKKDAELTIKALRYGAVDFIQKPDGEISDIDSIIDELAKKIRNTKYIRQKKIDLRKIEQFKNLSKEETLDITVAQYVVCIGASTGGPALLPELIGLLNPDFKAAVIIVQHMPPKYTAIFANQLAQITKLKVSEAKNNETIKEKHIYVCPGDRNLLVERSKIRLVEIPENSIWQPSIDETFMSVADNYFNKCIGVILTGMGNDGVQGAALIKARGGKIICQSPDTAMISRMPESVINAGFADFILAPRVIIAKLNHWQKNKYKF